MGSELQRLALILGVLLLAAGRVCAQPVTLQIGQSVAPLNGPWRFQVGDDPRWAAPGFDDSRWESVDLTPKPGAHDGDVGLRDYVAGWGSRGHKDYTGYAWYRLAVAVDARPGTRLAIAGPAAVDSAYQLFVDGRELGSIGRFGKGAPVAMAVQPRLFGLPPAPPGGGPRLIAVRVWIGPHLTSAPDAGGIRIAPKLGEAEAVAAAVQVQWRQTIAGYVVDALEGIAFLVLAAMAAALAPLYRGDRTYVWLAIALALSGVARGNQAVISWSQIETLQAYDLLRNVLLTPLILAAWIMAWRHWFKLRRPPWEPLAIGGLTALYLAVLLFSRAWLSPPTPHALALALRAATPWLRAPFLLIYFAVLVRGLVRRDRDAWLAGLAMLITGIALFPEELSLVHVKGIWFPYGVGVSRTEYAQAAMMLVLPALLLRRLYSFAPRPQTRAA